MRGRQPPTRSVHSRWVRTPRLRELLTIAYYLLVPMALLAHVPLPSRRLSCVLACAVAVLCCTSTAQSLLGAALFSRHGTLPCLSAQQHEDGPASPLRQLTPEEIDAFERDGAVVLHDVLSAEWVGRLRALVHDAFAHPTLWDVLYSRMVANFYCAQKAILLHHTSACGRQIAEAAPTTALAASLLRSGVLRVAEPSDALGNFRSHVWGGLDGCGTTGYHTDDAYIPLARREAATPAVVRLWMPLAHFGPEHFTFAALNMSAAARAERLRLGADELYGTQYARHERLVASGALDAPGQVIGGGGMRPGDVLAFAHETPHVAEAHGHGCAGAADGCLRLILSFAGDNAVYVRGRATGLLPLHDNQSEGGPPRGAQFPQAWPRMRGGADHEAEWAPLRPSLRTLGASLWHAVVAGSTSFSGYSPRQAARYVARVLWFSHPLTSFWDVPAEQLLANNGTGTTNGTDGARHESLWLLQHFGGAALSHAMGS